MLVLVGTLMFLPGIWVMPPIDRDEPRFAQASKQMLETGDVVDIRFQQEPRHKKPVATYWAQAAMVGMLGDDLMDEIGAYRTPSWLFMVISLLLTAKMGAVLAGPRAGLMAGLMLASFLLVGVEARLAKSDSLLLLSILMSMLAVAQIWVRQKPYRFLFYAGLGLGLLTKGPVIFIPVVGTILLLSLYRGELRWLKPLWVWWGPLVCLGLSAPWYMAITIKTGGAFFAESLGKDLGGKIAQAAERHGAPPGVHILALGLLAWPMTAYVPSLIRRFQVWRHEPFAPFCVAWFLSVFLVFELVATKLPHYTLPAYPALALALAAVSGRLSPSLAGLGPRLIVALPPVVIGASMLGATMVWALDPLWPLMTVSVLVILLGVVGFIMMRHLKSRAVIMLLGLSWLVQACVLHLWGPRLDPLWLAPQIAEAREDMSLFCPGPVGLMGYYEPSAIFLLGTDTAKLSMQELSQFKGLAFVNMENLPQGFMATNNMQLLDGTVIKGLNLNGGKKVHLQAWCVR